MEEKTGSWDERGRFRGMLTGSEVPERYRIDEIFPKPGLGISREDGVGIEIRIAGKGKVKKDLNREMGVRPIM